MVERDIRQRGIRDPALLSAMLRMPRHRFVEERLQPSAYQDRPLAIGEGQTISQPYIVAFMTELLELKGGERVLEIGTGSGYQSAILSLLAKEVYTIEILPGLAEKARKTLAGLGITNVAVRVGDGYRGWPEKAPFDAVVVTASADRIPDPLWSQMKEGGRLVMPVGKNSQRLVRARKIDGNRRIEELVPVIFVPMTGIIRDGAH
jgi:protein-L-isoaspartate(D-aspartate) O-methyltransferase